MKQTLRVPAWPFLVPLNVAVLRWPLCFAFGFGSVWELVCGLVCGLVALISSVGLVLSQRTRTNAELYSSTPDPTWAYFATIAVAVVSVPAGFLFSRDAATPVTLLIVVIALASSFGALAIREFTKRRPAPTRQVLSAPPAPIGHTSDGKPIYPVVGYTPDGQAITADRALGMKPEGTNSMAITSLITGLTIAPLGIIFGHIALSQIKRTGQDGKGMAIAGLVLGYVALASWIIVAIVVIVAFNNLN